MEQPEKWWWFMFPIPDKEDEDHVKSHVVPESLREPLLAELKARYRVEPIEFRELDEPEYWVDYGGMAVLDEPAVSVEVAGLAISMRVHVFEGFLRRLARSKERRFGDGPEYRKHHGWMTCLVLTPGQEEELHEKLAALSEEALRQDDEFCARLRERMQPLVEAGYITPPNIPDRKAPGEVN